MCLGFAKGFSGQADSCFVGLASQNIDARGAYYGVSTGSRAMVRRFLAEEFMTSQVTKKTVREGQYIAEVEVNLIESDEPWAPYLSLEDARKLDTVREFLRQGNVTSAQRLARVYRLVPVDAA